MKKILLSSVAVIATAVSALAADLPSRKAPVAPPPAVPMWTGFYAGVNAGYGWGTSNTVQNQTYALADYDSQYGYVYSPYFRAVGAYNDDTLARSGTTGSYTFNYTTSNPPTLFNNLLSNQLNVIFGNVGQTALAGNNSFAAKQSGFVGGGQIGYNRQSVIGGLDIVAGVEADIQGSAIRGNGSIAGASPGVASQLFATAAPSAALCPPTLAPSIGATPGTVSRSGTCDVSTGAESFSRGSLTSISVQNNVNWVGTVRGRLGWLLTPNLLIYGTGGLAYGQVTANVSVSQINNLTDNAVGVTNRYQFSNAPVLTPGAASTYSPVSWNPTPVGAATPFSISDPSTSVGYGSTNYSATKVGWTAGGGAEYMITPNWSVKAEGLYYYLGSAKLTTPVATNGWQTPTSAGFYTGGSLGTVNVTQTTVSWSGIMARGGVNYHFNWEPGPVVATY